MDFVNNKLLLIAGPCSLENKTICTVIAEILSELRETRPELQIVFKGSFDKANRSSISSYRGTGIEEGLELLQYIKERFEFPVTSDIHLPEQAEKVAKVCDILQIPAFLCRQTDLLVAAGSTGKIVNVKKGQFLSPTEMQFVIQKLEKTDAQSIWQTERGYAFGYQNLIVDMRVFPMLKAYRQPVIFDATHSVQLPGAGGGKTGGQRQFVLPLARAALAAGADGLFMETHPDPENATSDGPSQIPLSQFPDLIDDCLKVWRSVRSDL